MWTMFTLVLLTSKKQMIGSPKKASWAVSPSTVLYGMVKSWYSCLRRYVKTTGCGSCQTQKSVRALTTPINRLAVCISASSTGMKPHISMTLDGTMCAAKFKKLVMNLLSTTSRLFERGRNDVSVVSWKFKLQCAPRPNKGVNQKWADIDIFTPDPYLKNFCISISNPYPKISKI